MTVYTRNAAEVSSTFPELTGIATATGQRRLLLHGEIVALDQLGRPPFSPLQQRRPSPTLLQEVPVCFFAFDVLAIDDEDLTARTYVERRQALSALPLAGSRLLVIPPYWDDADPDDMLAAAADNGIESKRLDSQYVSGRSTASIKSPVRLTCELAIVGWWPPTGPGRSRRIGLLC